MTVEEIEEIRKAADEVWEIAKRLESVGFIGAARVVKEASEYLHEKGRLALAHPPI